MRHKIKQGHQAKLDTNILILDTQYLRLEKDTTFPNRKERSLTYWQTKIINTNYGVKKIMKEVVKGAWRMPWLSEAKKDVISCEKSWGVANKL